MRGERDELLTTTETAQVLGVHLHQVYRLVKRGELKRVRKGGHYGFRPQDVEAYSGKEVKVMPRRVLAS